MDHLHYANLARHLKELERELDSIVIRHEAEMHACRATMERYLANLSDEDHDEVIDLFGAPQ